MAPDGRNEHNPVKRAALECPFSVHIALQECPIPFGAAGNDLANSIRQIAEKSTARIPRDPIIAAFIGITSKPQILCT